MRMSKATIAACALAFAFGGVAAVATPHPQQDGARVWPDRPLSDDWAKWNAPVAPFRIAGDLYYVGAANVASYALRTSDGIVIFDTGFGQTVPQITANLRALGMDPRDVRLILTSHAHVDHVGGVAALKAATGARLLASGQDAALMARGGQKDFAFEDELPYRPVLADRIIRDGEVIRQGQYRLTAHVTPGHTKGCTTWSFRTGTGKAARDVLFLCGTSAPGYDLVDNPVWPGITEAYRGTFRRVAAIPCDIVLVGHPQSIDLVGRAAKGTLADRAYCRKTITDARVAFETEVARQEAGGAVGGD